MNRIAITFQIQNSAASGETFCVVDPPGLNRSTEVIGGIALRFRSCCFHPEK
jgi:hypothetical protein